MPTGWTLIGLIGNQGSSCPAQTTPTDVYESPSAPAAACACSCGADPTCPDGPIDVHYSQGNASCSLAGQPATMGDAAACNTDMYKGGNGLPFPSYKSLDLKYTPAASTGGGCGSTANPGALTYGASERECTPTTPPCNGSDCTPGFGNGVSVCVVQAGDVACPATTFTTKHLVGGTATFTCSDTACTCTWSADCTGTVKFFTNGDCTGTELDVAADNGCHPSGATSDTYGSYSYTNNGPSNVSCTSGGSSTAQGLALTNEQTVCCSP